MPRSKERQVFVSVDWLAAHLHDADLRIIDARLVPPTASHPRGEGLYAEGHIPGAVFVHWRQDLSLNTQPVPNLLLGPEAFAAKMGQCGVDAQTTVVVYDLGNVNWVARIWWALRYYGHDQVYVLEGGAAAWQEAGTPWTQAVVQPAPKTFIPRPRPAMRATKERVLAAVHDPATTIIETRRRDTISEAGGTVQGAYWLPSTTVFASQGAYQTLIPEQELDGYLQQIGADRAPQLVAT
jgi:thiosulfate/3-mercaptopyruvate sulfurtransferase